MSNILMVLTSHDRLGNRGRKTGFWLEEFAAPYYVFKNAGASITAASPRGGRPPIDPKSDAPGNQTASMTRFKGDKDAQSILSNTVPLATVEAKESISLVEESCGSGKPVAAVCHAPAVFHHVTFQGNPLVKGKRVTGFTSSEEEAVQLTKVVPFLVEEDLKSLGAHYEKAGDRESVAIVDGHLVTGQDPPRRLRRRDRGSAFSDRRGLS